MKSKHTPGPWIIHEGTNIFSESNRGRLIANTGGHQSNVNPGGVRKENEANATMIESTPDMLEALEEIAKCKGMTILSNLDFEMGAAEAFNQCAAIAESAMAKAKGER